MSLRIYRAKRDFARTKEPAGAKQPGRGGCACRFVVQKHAARRLHYDFRLEVGGVLKSWAVPNGMPTTQGEKRLAVQVEDHPLDYGSFEGTIAEGNYGAGTVMLWDTGTYETADGETAAALGKGKLSVVLRGRKLKGHWSLVRLQHDHSGKGNGWLLIKTAETARPISARANDHSVKTGRTLRQIGTAARKTIWSGHGKKK